MCLKLFRNCKALNMDSYLLDQSIYTLIFNLSGGPDIFLGSGTLKNQVQNMGWKGQGTKNRAIVIQKERRQPNLFSFWIKITLFLKPCFLHPVFCSTFFSGSQTDPCFQNKNCGCRLNRRLWLLCFISLKKQ